MRGITVDSGWLAGYARTVAAAADELDGARAALAAGGVSADAFGDAGRRVRAASKYAGASEALLRHLTDAVAALHATSEGLHEVAGRHDEQDQESAARFRRLDAER